MRFWLAGLLLSALPLAVHAQRKNTPSDTIFYDATAERLPSRAGAVRFIITSAQPTGGGVVQKIYAANGTLLEQIPYVDAQAKKREGVALKVFSSGAIRSRRTYRNGQLDGQLQLFYLNGNLQELSIYQQGQEKSKQCFDLDGQPMTCPVDKGVVPQGTVYAAYKAGRPALTAEISRKTRYPSLPNGAVPQRGQVVVACMIGVDGQLRESRIYKSVGPEYDREALRVVNELHGTFSPQLLNGEPTESFFTLEVNFLPPVQPKL
ncbi:TonB family protein [Hymenobacter cellulosilyticus]|uniref:TonB family protein n=1 Tax=Hymenobacter cellulosilyticus TaxID=2932248 RepID=A0A8T9Q6E9_9BACT|nr:TonB family protein [Hymenobacter cellulosilyticus]UOQ71039.1 TonB family protein [Hymenobacter cellulosilyticus]